MAEQRSDNMTAEMEEEGLTILQKIEDMEVYALPLIERWSIAQINAKMAVYLIALVLLSWLASMVGYDKVIQAITQCKKYKEE